MTCSKANPWKRKIVLGNKIRASHGYIDYVKTFGVFTSKSQIKENFNSRIRYVRIKENIYFSRFHKSALGDFLKCVEVIDAYKLKLIQRKISA